MANPTQVGQRFRTNFNNKIYTATGFYGRSGYDFPTYAEARKANPEGVICVKIKETNGGANVEDCEVIE